MGTTVFTLCWLLASGGSNAVQADVRLSSSSGQAVQLSSFVGRPTVLFYEDKESLELNRTLKNELSQLLSSRGWVRHTQVLAVANLQEFNWFPASQFALAGVRRAEARDNVTVYVDFDGALSSLLECKGSSGSWVLLLGPRGEVLFRHQGALSWEQRKNFLAMLESVTEKLWQKATASAN